MNDKPKVVHVNGITEADFNAWKHHPVTKALHVFLEGYAEALKRDHVERWLDGAVTPEEQTLARGRILAATELRTLGFQDMAEFYRGSSVTSVQSESDEEEDGRATD